MKRAFLFLLLIIGGTLAYGQSHLVNVHTAKSVMHGGAASSGVSTTHAYTFLAKQTVLMPHIIFEEKPLTLFKGDSLTVYFITYRSYHLEKDLMNNHEPKISYSSYFRAGKYHVSVNSEEEFVRAGTYQYKSKKYAVQRKDGIDTSVSHYAP